MCEFIIRIVDRETTGNKQIDATAAKAGSVVAIRPDGHKWGDCDLNNAEYMVVKRPDVSEEDMQHYLVPVTTLTDKGIEIIKYRETPLPTEFVLALTQVKEDFKHAKDVAVSIESKDWDAALQGQVALSADQVEIVP